MPNLVIDIGNTNTKLAVFDRQKLIYFKQVKEWDRETLAGLINSHQIENASVASVNKEIGELEEFLTQKINYFPFSTQINGGVDNRYETTATLGQDRWAKVLAANGLFKGKNCLMIDAGTCITYDMLTDTGIYHGGSISLGIGMRFQALHQFTARLPLVKWDREQTTIEVGNNTVNAIKSGVLQGVINEVEGFIHSADQKNKDLLILLTGGDADFLNKQLKNSIFATQIIHEPYLVLKGLNEAITLSYVQ